MSDYHVLSKTQINDKVEAYSVVFHIPIPDATNQIGHSYRAALAAEVNVDNPTRVPWLQSDFATEYQQILDGAVYEVTETVRAISSETLAEKRARIDARYNDLKAKILSEFQNKYAFWGFNRDVP